MQSARIIKYTVLGILKYLGCNLYKYFVKLATTVYTGNGSNVIVIHVQPYDTESITQMIAPRDWSMCTDVLYTGRPIYIVYILYTSIKWCHFLHPTVYEEISSPFRR